MSSARPRLVSVVLLGAVLAVGAHAADSASSARAWAASLDRATRAAAAGDDATVERVLHEVVAETGREAPDSLLHARALDGLADLARRRERFDEAAGLYGRSIPMLERLLGEDQPRVATSIHNLGVAELGRGRPERAAACFAEAAAIWSRTFGEDAPQTRIARQALGVATARASRGAATDDP